MVNAFVSGFGYDVPCAVASTVAHDSHHIIVVGTSKPDMARAANRLRELGGGVTVWREGAEIAHVALPIAGPDVRRAGRGGRRGRRRASSRR